MHYFVNKSFAWKMSIQHHECLFIITKYDLIVYIIVLQVTFYSKQCLQDLNSDLRNENFTSGTYQQTHKIWVKCGFD